MPNYKTNFSKSFRTRLVYFFVLFYLPAHKFGSPHEVDLIFH